MASPLSSLVTIVMGHINSASPALTSFSAKLSDRLAANEFIEALVNEHGLTLRTLVFIGSPVSIDSIALMCRSCPHLERLDISVPIRDLVRSIFHPFTFAVAEPQLLKYEDCVHERPHTVIYTNHPRGLGRYIAFSAQQPGVTYHRQCLPFDGTCPAVEEDCQWRQNMDSKPIPCDSGFICITATRSSPFPQGKRGPENELTVTLDRRRAYRPEKYWFQPRD